MADQQDAAVRLVSVSAQDPAIQYDGHWMDTTMQNSSSSKATTQPHNTATLSFGGTPPSHPPPPPTECAAVIFRDRCLPVWLDRPCESSNTQHRVLRRRKHHNRTRPVNLQGSDDGILNWKPQELCSQENLSDGNHTIKVIVTQATEEYSFIIDKLKFRLSAEQFKSLSGGGMTNTSGIEASPSAAPSSPQGVAGGSQPRSITLAIVGGALALVGLLSLVALALFLLSRRRKGQAYSVLSDSECPKFETPISSPFALEPAPSAIMGHHISPLRKDSGTGATYNPSTDSDNTLSDPDPEKDAWQDGTAAPVRTLVQRDGEEIPLDANTYSYRSSRRISAVLLDVLRRWTRNIGSGNSTRRSSSGAVIAVSSRPETPFAEPPPGYSERP
ncbi:hypothetical protein C8Q78DRAFT_846836 [Trametes maxima]|nr:hypothetical protein C8Q78DRAFT_846836 [Trametes maxima]